MATKLEQDLQKIEKAIVKLRNKMKRVDLNYTVQASISSVDPTKVKYAAQITAPAEGLAPVTFIAEDAETLLTQVKQQQKLIDYKAIEKAYHEAQIEACKRTIQFHEERKADLDKPETEETKEETSSDTDEEHTI